MLSGAGAGISSLPSSFSSSEHKSDSSSVNSQTLLPQPSSAAPPTTADQVIELSVSSDELASWRRRHQHPQSGPMPWPGRTRNVLRRYSPLVPPTAILIALVVLLVQDLAHARADSLDLPGESNETVLQWSTCELDNAIANLYNLSAQCVTVTLPLCYNGICETVDDNATIAVSFKRIPALGTNDSSVSKQTVWYLPDRPNVQTREDAELQMTLLYEEMRGEVDIYTLDLRGSGNSTPLACNTSDRSPLQTAIFARNGGVLNFSDVQNCASRLQELGYIDLKAFSLTSAARDVEQVITEFQADSEVIVYALGYGTLVAQKLVQRNISQIAGYTLDGALGGPKRAISLSSGAETLSYDVTRSDGDFGDVGDDFLSWCQADTDCSEMFSDVSTTTTLNSTLVEVYTRLDADTTSMCAMILIDADTSGNYNSATTTSTTPPSYLLRQLLGVMLKSATLWPFIPVLVYRFHRCGSEDLTLLTQLVNNTFATELLDESIPDLLFVIQTFSELWETISPDQTELTKRFTDATISSGRVYSQLQAYCMFTGATSDACVNVSASASSSSSVEVLLSYQETTMNSSAAVLPPGSSVLFLSGGLDALSPPKYATTLFNALQTESKALLVAPHGTHGVVQTALLSNGTACARQVLASYVLSSGNLSAYDASCLTDLPAPNLAISNTSSLLVLGVADAYDGVLDISNSNSSSGSGSVGVISNSGSSESSASPGSSLDELNNRISALESSRYRYEVALIVVASVLAAVLLAGIAVFIYRHRRTHQLAGEEAMLRRMRGDEENELEIMRSIYLLSSSSPSSGEAGRPTTCQHI